MRTAFRQEHNQGVLRGRRRASRSLEDDVTFHLDIVGGAAAVRHHIGDQVDGQRQGAAEHVGVVAGSLAVGAFQFPATARSHRLRNVTAERVGVDEQQMLRKCAARPP